jgi:hypothetical protein
MALVKGTNSYATIAEADAYFANRLENDAWLALTNPQKERALVTATRNLDLLEWEGTIASESQPLAFPRVGTYFDARVGGYVTFGSEPPALVIQALYEMAFAASVNIGNVSDGVTVDSISVGPISISGLKGSGSPTSTGERPSKAMANALYYLLRQGKQGGGYSWWMAN